MPEPKITHIVELVDPTTGHTVVLAADTAVRLDELVQQHLEQSFPSA